MAKLYVKDCMSDHPEWISPETTLKEAAEKMWQGHYGFLPVCDGGKLQGVLTDRDIVIRAVREGLDPSKATAGEFMTPQLHYCYMDDELGSAADLMEKEQLHRLCVLDGEKHLEGVLSLGDIARKSHDEKLCGELVEAISED